VELGKSIARQILPALEGQTDDLSSFDTATRALLDEIAQRREG